MNYKRNLVISGELTLWQSLQSREYSATVWLYLNQFDRIDNEAQYRGGVGHSPSLEPLLSFAAYSRTLVSTPIRGKCGLVIAS